ncbi:MAG: GGDEF domain-containing protein [Elusimicrobia bacterium]|nr:GGDEF domain-containing protein [Elusimicrobiota bacterium]
MNAVSKKGAQPLDFGDPLVYLSTHYIQAKEYLEAIVGSTSDAICTTDMNGRIIFFSPGAEKMFRRNASQVVGTTVDRFYEGGRKEAERVMRLLTSQGKLDNYQAVMSVDGRRFHVSMSLALLKDKTGKCIGTLGISKDVTERVQLEEKLRELSIKDNLTGLFNQRHFHDRFSDEVQRSRRLRQRLALVLIDLDHFKEINDTVGHLEGDRILRKMGDAVTRSIRGGVDAGFRYGGDEFIVLLPGQGERRASIVAGRIRDAFRSLCADSKVDLSYGIASRRTQESAEQLLGRADGLMYKQKRSKKRR